MLNKALQDLEDAQITKHSWLRKSDLSIVEVGGISITDNELSINGQLINIADVFFDKSDLPVSFFTTSNLRIEKYIRYNPLVYYTVFGNRKIFELLEISIKSLQQCSGCDFTTLIITRNEDLEILDYYLREVDKSKIIIDTIEATSVLEFTSARYKLCEIEAYRDYSPILYIDTDVMCNSSILKIFKNSLIEEKVMAVIEGPLLDKEGHWGNLLFQNDLVSLDAAQTKKGFSTGMLSASHAGKLSLLWDLVRRLSNQWRESGQQMFGAYDQPFANYIAERLDLVDIMKLGQWAKLHPCYMKPSLLEKRGLIHFLGGVGNADPKKAAMCRYANMIGLSGIAQVENKDMS